MPLEQLKHACGLFAIWARGSSVAWLTAQALDSQQTRGQEGAGIATTDGLDFYLKKGRGLVIQVFRSIKSVARLIGYAAIGHTRYSTTGRDAACNVQPLRVEGPNGEVCLGHNGNLINAGELRSELEALGEVFETTTDSEVIAKLLVRAPGANWVDRLSYVMNRILGSYCLVILTKESILLTRDPTGNRPLCIGRSDGCWAAASESGVFNNQPFEFIREVEPGEIIVFNDEGMTSYEGRPTNGSLGLCGFELIYFLRPDSVFGGVEAYTTRYRAGSLLARIYPAEADIVVPVPRSGLYAGDGYTAESGIPVAHGVVVNLLSRVFINPDKLERVEKLELKYSTTSILEGKRIVVVDDSVVRGNSNNRVFEILRAVGVSEIHFRSTFPPIVRPCHLGIDMATDEELIAAKYGGDKEKVEQELEKHWGVTSVRYLSVPQLVSVIGLPESKLCLGCVGGRYAVDMPADIRKDEFERVPAMTE